jgi:hypothetical protein
VVKVRKWVSKREKARAAAANETPTESAAIRVVPVSGGDGAEAVELFVAPGTPLPVEGQLVHLRVVARGKGWQTVLTIHPDGSTTETRRNAGTAFSVREVLAA